MTSTAAESSDAQLNVRMEVLGDLLRQAGLSESDVRLLVAAPMLLAEHEKTFAQLVRMNAMLQQVGRSRPLAIEVDSALRGTVRAIRAVNERLSVEDLRALVDLTPEAFDACASTVACLLGSPPSDPSDSERATKPTTTTTDLFQEYAKRCGSQGPLATNEQLQDDYEAWAETWGVPLQDERTRQAYLDADDGPFDMATVRRWQHIASLRCLRHASNGRDRAMEVGP